MCRDDHKVGFHLILLLKKAFMAKTSSSNCSVVCYIQSLDRSPYHDQTLIVLVYRKNTEA